MYNLFLLHAFLFGVLLAPSCLGQKVPVSIVASASGNEDPTGLRFSSSLSHEIQLSEKFYEWPGRISGLPSNGVLIHMTLIDVRLKNGEDLDSAIVIRADRPSANDPEYYKLVSEHAWMILRDGDVTDLIRSFLAEVDTEMTKSIPR
jgi:hypothetical protein